MQASAAPTLPPRLLRLAAVEMWERFSYLGMRSLLVLFLVQESHAPRREATALYGAYTGLIYLACLLGGATSDRLLGARRSALLGGASILAGHLLLGLGAAQSGGPNGAFLAGLSLIVAGTGFFHPNLMTLVGRLYGPDDPARDGGFSLYYMGINLGGAAAALTCGTLAARLGWGWAFGAAAVGMAVGLGLLLRLAPRLRDLDGRERPRWVAGAAVLLAGALGARALLGAPPLLGGVLGVSVVAGMGVLLASALAGGDATARSRIIAFPAFWAALVLFKAAFEQAGSSLTLFAAEAVDLRLGPLTLAPSAAQAFNPIFVVLLAPLAARLWTSLGTRGREPSTPVKFALGLALTGAGFGLLWLGIGLSADGRTPAAWLAGAYLLHTLGELCIIPIGYALVGRLTPPSMQGFAMGVWLLGYAAASWLAGAAAGRGLGTPGGPAGVSAYAQLFAQAALGLGVGATVLLIAAPLLKAALRAAPPETVPCP